MATPGAGDLTQRLTIIARSRGSATDGIRDHGEHLAAAVDGVPGWSARTVDLVTRRPADLAAAADVRAGDAVLLQYNPFSYGWRGLAPWLPLALGRLRRGRPDVRVAMLVHEPFVPPTTPVWRFLHVTHRAQLSVLARTADVRFATTQRWIPAIGPARVLPVGSNLPDRRDARAQMRARLSAGPDTLVLTAFGTSHPARQFDVIARAITEIATTRDDVLVLNLGAGSPELPVPARQVTPGRVDGDVLAQHLAAGDVVLAPYVDGVSTRRTTIMAALQHGVPVVSTRARDLDPQLEGDTGLAFAEVGDTPGFVAAAQGLGADAERRERAGRAARATYEREFAWPVIARRLVEAFDAR